MCGSTRWGRESLQIDAARAVDGVGDGPCAHDRLDGGVTLVASSKWLQRFVVLRLERAAAPDAKKQRRHRMFVGRGALTGAPVISLAGYAFPLAETKSTPARVLRLAGLEPARDPSSKGKKKPRRFWDDERDGDWNDFGGCL